MRLAIAVAAMMMSATGAFGQFAPAISGNGGRLPNAYRIDATPPGPSIGREVGDIRDRIGHARRSGDLSRREARQLRNEADQIGVLADRYAAGGMSAAERRELDTRARVLRSDVDRQRMQGQARR